MALDHAYHRGEGVGDLGARGDELQDAGFVFEEHPGPAVLGEVAGDEYHPGDIGIVEQVRGHDFDGDPVAFRVGHPEHVGQLLARGVQTLLEALQRPFLVVGMHQCGHVEVDPELCRVAQNVAVLAGRAADPSVAVHHGDGLCDLGEDGAHEVIALGQLGLGPALFGQVLGEHHDAVEAAVGVHDRQGRGDRG